MAGGLGDKIRAADPAPYAADLVLHFDAAAQAEARRAGSLPPLGNGAPVDRWLDLSGSNLEAVQPVAGARPVHRSSEGGHGQAGEAFARFDGVDDFLPVNAPRQLSAELTVFVLAAPAAIRAVSPLCFRPLPPGRMITPVA